MCTTFFWVYYRCLQRVLLSTLYYRLPLSPSSALSFTLTHFTLLIVVAASAPTDVVTYSSLCDLLFACNSCALAALRLSLMRSGHTHFMTTINEHTTYIHTHTLPSTIHFFAGDALLCARRFSSSYFGRARVRLLLRQSGKNASSTSAGNEVNFRSIWRALFFFSDLLSF